MNMVQPVVTTIHFPGLPAVCRIDGAKLDTRKSHFKSGQPNPKAGQDYNTIQDEALVRLVQNPPRLDKLNAFATIPSTYHGPDARSPNAQKEQGVYHYLWADVDHGNYTKAQVLAAARYAVGGGPRVIVFSSYNSWNPAEPYNGESRWRIMVATEQGIPGSYFSYYQQAFLSMLAAGGLNLALDRVSERTAQLCILPALSPTNIYDYAIDGTELLNLRHHPLNEGATYYYHQQPPTPVNTAAATSLGPRTYFNESCNIEDVMLQCGFDSQDGKNWRSPYQRELGSGNYSSQIRYYQDRSPRVVTLSQTDADCARCLHGGQAARYWDAFDLISEFQYEGDTRRATNECRHRFQYNIRPDNPSPHLRSLEAMTEHGKGLAVQAIEACWRAVQRERAIAVEEYKESRRPRVPEAGFNGPWVDEVPFELTTMSKYEWAAWHAPGLIGDIVRTMAPEMKRCTLVPALMGAVAFVSYMTQGRYVAVVEGSSQFMTPPAILMLMLAPTGAGKGDVYSVFRKCVARTEDLGIQSKSEVLSGLTSKAAFQAQAATNPNLVVFDDEAGVSQVSQRGDKHREGLIGILTSAYTAFQYGIAAVKGASDETSRAPVHNPQLTMMWVSTPEKFKSGVNSNDSESGWLGRWVTLGVKKAKLNFDIKTKRKEAKLGPSFDSWCRTVGSFTPPPKSMAPADVYYHGKLEAFYKMGYSEEAAESLCDIMHHYSDPDPNKVTTEEQNIMSRAAEAINRLSVIACLACGRTEVQKSDLEWAKVIVEDSYHQTAATVQESQDFSESELWRKIATVFMLINRGTDSKKRNSYGAIPYDEGYAIPRAKLVANLTTNTATCTRRHVTEAIDDALELGHIQEVMVAGRKGAWYILTL